MATASTEKRARPTLTAMVDFHTHILPGIDDGSRSVEESLQMLRAMPEVSHVVATPHFYARENTPERFLRRRAASWTRLWERLDGTGPDIRLGAEVCYFEGICRSDELSALCIEGTNVLLLEMPFDSWSSRAFNDLLELGHRADIQIVLAHAERYDIFYHKRDWQHIADSPILIQCNAAFFLHLRTRHRALRRLENGYIHLLGSDCHGIERRAPNLGEAAQVIRKHLGENALRDIDRMALYLLDGKGVE